MAKPEVNREIFNSYYMLKYSNIKQSILFFVSAEKVCFVCF
jgi:hypothetical protein